MAGFTGSPAPAHVALDGLAAGHAHGPAARRLHLEDARQIGRARRWGQQRLDLGGEVRPFQDVAQRVGEPAAVVGRAGLQEGAELRDHPVDVRRDLAASRLHSVSTAEAGSMGVR